MSTSKENKERFKQFIRDLDEREPIVLYDIYLHRLEHLRHEVIHGIDFYVENDAEKKV